MSAPYSRLISPSATIKGVAARIWAANNGKPIAMNPYNPALDCTALTTATTGGGNSPYVAGIQVWNGKTGVLTKNAKAKPLKIQAPQTLPIVRPACGFPITSVEPLTTPKAAVASSRHKPPAR